MDKVFAYYENGNLKEIEFFTNRKQILVKSQWITYL